MIQLGAEDVTTIGRHPESVICLNDPSVSGHHATIKRRERGWYVDDLSSSNGTRLNGAEIEEALLNDGDRVAYGDVQTVFYSDQPPATLTEPAAAPPPPALRPPPPPDVGKIEEAAPVTGAPVIPRRGPRRFVPRRTAAASGYPDQTGSGCATAMFLTLLFIVAFFVGLSLRHNKETDRSLMSDLFNRITKSLPKVKIEQ